MPPSRASCSVMLVGDAGFERVTSSVSTIPAVVEDIRETTPRRARACCAGRGRYVRRELVAQVVTHPVFDHTSAAAGYQRPVTRR